MRNAKALQSKSKQHLITRLSPTSYRLTSGSSGNQYIINSDTLSCSCPYGQHRPTNDKRSGCSHVVAVLSYIKKMEEERTLTICATEEAALKSKRALAGGFDGLIILSRKA